MSSMTDNKPVDDGGAAFPEAIAISPAGDVYPGMPGMSLRDWFAGRAITAAGALVMHPDARPSRGEGPLGVKHIAYIAYEIADAMLAAREDSRHDR